MTAFKVVVSLFGAFILGTGLLEIALGPAALPGAETATPGADSNYRFFAASWLALGLVLLWGRQNRTVVRAVSATVFAGGLARLVSWVSVGTPQPMILVLLGIELVVPPLLVWWHSRLSVPSR